MRGQRFRSFIGGSRLIDRDPEQHPNEVLGRRCRVVDVEQMLGRDRFPEASTLMITVDAGGSNGPRVRAFKYHLAQLAAETGLSITVCHYPPGTSKWNKMEHRLFSFISLNWRGRSLTDIRTIVELIAATKTKTGLTVQCGYDPNWYPTDVKISDHDYAAIPLRLARRVEVQHRRVNRASCPAAGPK
jgi:hypothetical protein